MASKFFYLGLLQQDTDVQINLKTFNNTYYAFKSTATMAEIFFKDNCILLQHVFLRLQTQRNINSSVMKIVKIASFTSTYCLRCRFERR